MPDWLESNSQRIGVDELRIEGAVAVAAFIRLYGDLNAIRLKEVRKTEDGSFEFLIVDIDVDLPQRPEVSIAQTESIAVAINSRTGFPSILALRPGFPETMHRNLSRDGEPPSLCVDDRPWQESRLSWNPNDFIGRIRTWLRKAANGELHDPIQPLDPLYFSEPQKIILPRDALIDPEKSGRLIACFIDENRDVFITRIASNDFVNEATKGRVVVLPVALPAQPMQRMRRAPRTLEHLVKDIEAVGVDLLSELRKKIDEWSVHQGANKGVLTAFLAICIITPIKNEQTGEIALDYKAFWTAPKSVGDVGVSIGVLIQVEDKDEVKKANVSYVKMISPDKSRAGQSIDLITLDPILDFDSKLATSISGQEKLTSKRGVLIGAGSLGSHVAMCLAREGAFRWTIVDKDALLPHNLARHVLNRHYLGHYKAASLSSEICWLTADSDAAQSIVTDILAPDEAKSKLLDDAFSSSEVILDCSASIAVARHLCDLKQSTARRISIFFNPAGTAIVLLAESASRSISLRELESQYYRLVMRSPELAQHLTEEVSGFRYTGSCRELTNRIPEHNAATLSAIGAKGLIDALNSDEACLKIWKLEDTGEVKLISAKATDSLSVKSGDWTISSDRELRTRLKELRATHLPNETGGVLLGVVDHPARTVLVVDALDAPLDSVRSPTEFERGVQGLLPEITRLSKQTLHQVRYVGEWHSHPKGVLPEPSSTDIRQLAGLAMHLDADGIPATMMIIGDGEPTINIGVATTGWNVNAGNDKGPGGAKNGR
jgi:integrative and conjugative element protein (TIGR02256 family)